MLSIHNLATLGKQARGRVRDALYDRGPDGETVEVSELGWPQWGYLHARSRRGVGDQSRVHPAHALWPLRKTLKQAASQSSAGEQGRRAGSPPS